MRHILQACKIYWQCLLKSRTWLLYAYDFKEINEITIYYIVFTIELFLLTAFESHYLGVLLIMSGRHEAGSFFSITCNATREE